MTIDPAADPSDYEAAQQAAWDLHRRRVDAHYDATVAKLFHGDTDPAADPHQQPADPCCHRAANSAQTGSSDRPDLEAIAARNEAAHQHVVKLCSGEERWTMRVPAQPGRDSDLVIDDALSDVPELLSYARRLEAERLNLATERLRETLRADKAETERDRLRGERDWAEMGKNGFTSDRAARDRQVAAATGQQIAKVIMGRCEGSHLDMGLGLPDDCEHQQYAALARAVAGELEVPDAA